MILPVIWQDTSQGKNASMSPTAYEAERALRDIATINRRAAGFQDYQAESLQLMLWGLFYMIGFAGVAAFELPVLLWWGGLLVVTVLFGSRLVSRGDPDSPGIIGRYLLVLAIILGFVVLMTITLQPLTDQQVSLLAPVFVSVLYLLRGTQLPRYLLIGISLLLPCLVSYWMAGEHFWWAMSLACGAPMLGAGLWLRFG